MAKKPLKLNPVEPTIAERVKLTIQSVKRQRDIQIQYYDMILDQLYQLQGPADDTDLSRRQKNWTPSQWKTFLKSGNLYPRR